MVQRLQYFPYMRQCLFIYIVKRQELVGDMNFSELSFADSYCLINKYGKYKPMELSTFSGKVPLQSSSRFFSLCFIRIRSTLSSSTHSISLPAYRPKWVSEFPSYFPALLISFACSDYLSDLSVIFHCTRSPTFSVGNVKAIQSYSLLSLTMYQERSQGYFSGGVLGKNEKSISFREKAFLLYYT